MTLSPAAQGALFMATASAVFAVQNALVKLLGQRLDPFQIAFFRCVFALLATLPWLLMAAGLAGFRTRRLGGHFLRALFGY